MNKKVKRICLFVMMVTFAIGLLAGCTLGPTKQGIIDEFGLVAKINYFANGGDFGGDGITHKEIYYSEGARPLNISGEGVSVTSGSIKVVKRKYTFDGWYEALKDQNGDYLSVEGQPIKVDEKFYVLDENGNPTKDKLGSFEVQLDFSKPLDTQRKMQKDDVFNYFAYWVTDVKVEIRFVSEDGGDIVLKGKEENVTIENLGLYKSMGFDIRNEVVKPDDIKETVVDNAYTWIREYYYDVECTQVVSWPIKKGEAKENISVYAKYIKGNWIVIHNKSSFNDFVEKSALNSSIKGYMISSIDLNGERFNVNLINSELHGNGFSIKNFKVQASASQTALGNGKVLSFIGKIGAKALLKDITFEDITLTADVQSSLSGQTEVSIYAFFREVDEAARFESVTIKNVNVIISLNPEKSYISNIQKPEGSEEYNTSNVLFGGFESDAKFLEKYTGVTVDTQTLVVNITEKN